MESLKLLFVGDIMPGGVLHYQDLFYTDGIKQFMQKFDLRIGTLEVAIGDNIPFDKEKMKGRMNIIYCKNSDAQKLLDLDINIVSLANNHIFDLGIEGLENTKQILSENNIKYCGAGKNIKEASEPIIMNYNGKRIVFLAYSDWHNELHLHMYRNRFYHQTGSFERLNKTIQRCGHGQDRRRRRLLYCHLLSRCGRLSPFVCWHR